MRVKREQVLDFVISRGFSPFTTTDLADALHANEYAVRAAVSWLKLGGFIKFYCWHEDRDHVKVYKWTGKSSSISTVRRNQEEREDVQLRDKFKTTDDMQHLLMMMCKG